MQVDLSEHHSAAERAIASVRSELCSLADDIHAHPELCFEEHHAHRVLVDFLGERGFEMEEGAGGLATAFVGRVGSGEGPDVAIVCEYDALPELGHGCGHNLIAAAGVGAALGAACAIGHLDGRLRVIGTPAEEGGGGKVRLVEAGVFAGVDAAMMVHPADRDLTHMSTLAIDQLEVHYTGVAAHAAAAPHEGRNALDAAVLGYVNVAALRQHLRPAERVHGVFTHAGDKPNVVPHRAGTHWYVRAENTERLDEVKERVLACLRAGALAAGCEMTHRWSDTPYAEMWDNGPLVQRFVAHAARLGRDVRAPDASTSVVGSTDMGNVSHLMPTIHPLVAAAPPGTPIHTEGFATAAGGPQGHDAVIAGAVALACTAIDLWGDPTVLEEARLSFGRRRASSEGSDPASSLRP